MCAEGERREQVNLTWYSEARGGWKWETRLLRCIMQDSAKIDFYRLSPVGNREVLMNAEHVRDIIRVMGSFTPLCHSHYSNANFPYSHNIASIHLPLSVPSHPDLFLSSFQFLISS